MLQLLVNVVSCIIGIMFGIFVQVGPGLILGVINKDIFWPISYGITGGIYISIFKTNLRFYITSKQTKKAIRLLLFSLPGMCIFMTLLNVAAYYFAMFVIEKIS